MMLAWKMAPCLAAGNTVIIKPAEVRAGRERGREGGGGGRGHRLVVCGF